MSVQISLSSNFLSPSRELMDSCTNFPCIDWSKSEVVQNLFKKIINYIPEDELSLSVDPQDVVIRIVKDEGEENRYISEFHCYPFIDNLKEQINCAFFLESYKRSEGKSFVRINAEQSAGEYGNVNEKSVDLLFEDFKFHIDSIQDKVQIDSPKAIDSPIIVDSPKAIDSPIIVDPPKAIDSPIIVDLPKILDPLKADNSEVSSFYLALASAGVVGLTLCLYKIHSIMSKHWSKEQKAPQTTQLKVDKNKKVIVIN